MDTPLPIIGVLRPAHGEAGLAEPVAGGLGGFWTQTVSDGRVSGFAPADLTRGHLVEFPPSVVGKRFRFVAPGDPRLFAFVLPGGRPLFGSTEELASRLRDAWALLASDPRALADAENFLFEVGETPPDRESVG